MLEKVILISPRGFCAGVERAIDTLEKVIQLYEPPIYVNHEIVHNQYIVKNFQNRGVIFVKSLEEVPNNSLIVFSAHGVSPSIINLAKQKNLKIIDATCPLVTKVHLEARRYSKLGYKILFIGHKNHQETIGTYGEAPDQTIIIEDIQDAKNLKLENEEKLVCLTQTTLSVYDTTHIISILKNRFSNLEFPSKSDICYATTNRQSAIKSVINRIDLLLVVGAKNSSNSNRLMELGIDNEILAYLIQDKNQINDSWFSDNVKTVAITSGASTPDFLVMDILNRLKEKFTGITIENFQDKKENVSFKLPTIVS